MSTLKETNPRSKGRIRKEVGNRPGQVFACIAGAVLVASGVYLKNNYEKEVLTVTACIAEQPAANTVNEQMIRCLTRGVSGGAPVDGRKFLLNGPISQVIEYKTSIGSLEPIVQFFVLGTLFTVAAYFGISSIVDSQIPDSIDASRNQ